MIKKLLIFFTLFTLTAQANDLECEPRLLAQSGLNKLGVQAPARPSDEKTMGCDRGFKPEPQSKPQSIDSFHRRDAEMLRKYVDNMPEAKSELDLYQRNRRMVLKAAYVGTAGAIVLLTGLILSSQTTSASHKNNYRAIGVFAGGGLIAGSFVWGLSLLRSNEEHLINAVNIHNEKNPNKPIELQFTTGLVF